MRYTPNLTRSEWKQGFIAMVFCLAVLPGLLEFLPDTIRPGQKNFICYCLNFGIVTYVFRGFLGRNLRTALALPFPTIYYAVLGYLAQMALGQLTSTVIFLLSPGFFNLNDQTILNQLDQDFTVLAVSMVLLVPVAEECFFRGLLFRGVYDRSPAAAWALSVGLFAALHVVGYIGTGTPLDLLLSFIQYLPAGIALCFTYQRGGSIIAPILMHTIVNAVALYNAMG